MLPISTPIKIIIADDHSTTRRGIQDFLRQRDDIEIVLLAANGKEVLQAMQDIQPNVVLTDIKMPVLEGRELCKTVVQQYPEVRVIAFTMFDHTDIIIEMHNAGASGFVLKTSSEDEIIKAIHAVNDGGEYYCSSVRQRINVLFRTRRFGFAEQEKKREYSDKQLKIIELVCQEMSSKEIGDELGLSSRTIEHEQEKIRSMMGVKSVVGIALYAVKNWLLY